MRSTDNAPVLKHLHGREDEIQQIQTLLQQGGPACWILLGSGGAGKTRLLYEVQAQLPHDSQPRIYDFYHIDNFKASQIEAHIIATILAILPDADFTNYWRKRVRLETARQSGTQFQRASNELREQFVLDYNAAAARVRALGRNVVLLFDTVEQAVNLTDPAESQLIGDQHSATDGGQFWLQDILPQLKHSIIILSGRHKTLYGQDVELYNSLVDTMSATKYNLAGLSLEASHNFLDEVRGYFLRSSVEEVKEYARGKKFDSHWLTVCNEIANGQPFWLTMFYTCDMLTAIPKKVDLLYERCYQGLPISLSPEEREQQRSAIMISILDNYDLTSNRWIFVLNWLATARKGLNREMLGRLIEAEQFDFDAEELFEDLKKLLIVKSRDLSYGDASDEQETRLFLHDEMYFWLDTNRDEAKKRRTKVIQTLLTWYDEAITEVEKKRLKVIEELLEKEQDDPRVPQLVQRRNALLQRERYLVLDRMSYYYQQDQETGRAEYNLRSYAAISAREYGYGVTLRQEALRNLYRLGQQVSLPVEVECAARWMLRAVWAEDAEQALQMLPKLKYYYDQETGTPGLHYALLYLAEAQAVFNFKYTGNTAYVKQCLDRARHTVEQITDLSGIEAAWRDILLAQIYNSYGLLSRREYELYDASVEYRESLRLALSHPDLLRELQAPTFNNLAFVYSEQGDVVEARRLARQGLRLNQRYGTDYYIGLSNNTLARIEIRSGLVRRAQQYAERARQIFERLDSPRGLSLCLPVLAYTYRKIAEHLDDDIPAQDQLFKTSQQIFEEAVALLEKYNITAAERRREAYQGLGCTYRSQGQALYRRNDPHNQAPKMFQDAYRTLTQALEIAQQQGQPKLIQLDILEDLAVILVNQDEFDGRVEEYINLAESLAPDKYKIQRGAGLPDVEGPIRGFWRELGQCQLQRMLSSFGAFDIGYVQLGEPGQATIIRKGDEDDLKRAAQHMLFTFAYLLKYDQLGSMRERAVELTLRELRLGRTEQQLELMRQEVLQTAQEYGFTRSDALELCLKLLDIAQVDLDLNLPSF